MSDKTFDPFAPSTGLADDFDADIVNAEFGYRSNYQNGEQALLILTIKSTDGTALGKEGDLETEVIYSCGPAWEVTPGSNGESVRRGDGKQIGFNENSAIFHFITSCVKHDGGVLRKSGNPMHIAGYRALSGFHWKREKYEGMNGTKDRLVPSGKSGSTGAAATATAPASNGSASTAAAKLAAAKAAQSDGLDDETRAQLVEIATTTKGAGGDHEAYVAAVFGANAAWEESEAVNNAILSDAAGSIWASA